MTGSGAIELPLFLFQLFFMVAGVVGGMRLIDDILRWRQARTESTDA